MKFPGLNMLPITMTYLEKNKPSTNTSMNPGTMCKVAIKIRIVVEIKIGMRSLKAMYESTIRGSSLPEAMNIKNDDDGTTLQKININATVVLMSKSLRPRAHLWRRSKAVSRKTGRVLAIKQP
jgi:hypothetical protein